MGGAPVYSSMSGPAKWAAVVVLSAASGAGLMYSFTRQPRPVQAVSPVVQLPARSSAGPRAVSPAPKADAPVAPKTAPEGDAAGPSAPEGGAEPAPPVSEVLAPEPLPEPEPEPIKPQKININTASQQELELLPRVGPSMAKAIIAYRTTKGRFRSLADLDKVEGIGPKTVERLAPLVTVD
jgi:competence ComEA-like helix-hairpin-helix protein